MPSEATTSPAAPELEESDPLVERIDALLKRHQQPPPSPSVVDAPERLVDVPPPDIDDDIPVLTEIVDLPGRAAQPAAIEPLSIESLLAELDEALSMRLNRALGNLLEQSLDGLRAELSSSVRSLVREAVEKALADDLRKRNRLP